MSSGTPTPANPYLDDSDYDDASPLTRKQLAFAAEYAHDRLYTPGEGLNATRAAIRAGYASTGASAAATRMLRDPRVLALIDRHIEQRRSRSTLVQDAVLHEMTLIANSDLDHYIVDDEGNVQLAPDAPEGAMRAIQSIKKKCTIRMDKDDVITKTYDVEIKLWDKGTPLKLIGQQSGLFVEKREHTGKDGGPIETVNRIERVILDKNRPTRAAYADD